MLRDKYGVGTNDNGTQYYPANGSISKHDSTEVAWSQASTKKTPNYQKDYGADADNHTDLRKFQALIPGIADVVPKRDQVTHREAHETHFGCGRAHDNEYR